MKGWLSTANTIQYNSLKKHTYLRINRIINILTTYYTIEYAYFKLK